MKKRRGIGNQKWLIYGKWSKKKMGTRDMKKNGRNERILNQNYVNIQRKWMKEMFTKENGKK